jgi:hypothetical protein
MQQTLLIGLCNAKKRSRLQTAVGRSNGQWVSRNGQTSNSVDRLLVEIDITGRDGLLRKLAQHPAEVTGTPAFEVGFR